MAGAFSVEWLPGSVLLQRRTGRLSVEEAQQYVDAVKRAAESPPTPAWGCVVDTRDTPPQTEDVQRIIGELIKFVVAHGVVRVAMVSNGVVTDMQQRRVTTSPGMHDPSTVAFYADLDEAVADVRKALPGH